MTDRRKIGGDRVNLTTSYKDVDLELEQDETAIQAVYDEQEFQQGVIRQARLSLAGSIQCKLSESRRQLSSIDDDIVQAESKLKEMEHTLDDLLGEFDQGKFNQPRKIRSLECEIERQMAKLETLKSRRRACSNKVQSLATDSDSVRRQLVNEDEDGECSELKVAGQSLLPRSDATSTFSATVTPSSSVAHHQPPAKKVRLGRDRTNALTRSNKKSSINRGKTEPSVDNADKDEDSFVSLDHGLRIPASLWSRLYPYQQSAVSWLWGLHQRGSGGILGDEMGLGKTIEIIAFLAALHCSDLPTDGLRLRDNAGSIIGGHHRGLGSVLLVAPATVIQQWMTEFDKWAPSIRVAALHSSQHGGYYKPLKLIRSIGGQSSQGGVLITTYSTLTSHVDNLVNFTWSYVILDEGHKIKNPEADVTTAVKRFNSPHRLILSGSPMQNNLRELWSMFDFTCPGRLGPLPVFMQEFAIPITIGGYASASPFEVESAYQCACTLRDLLAPFLLRRLKSEVKLELPSKSEKVLFCSLTPFQDQLYREFLASKACKDVLTNRGSLFKALITLRKLCNHPDLVVGLPRDAEPQSSESSTTSSQSNLLRHRYPWRRFGSPLRSSKMQVVASLVTTWTRQEHKTLIFSQSRMMLTLLGRMLHCLGIAFLRMDGQTPIGQRQSLVAQFNNGDNNQGDVPVFLLTTRVGGLGVNLTGANRVLIFDPDWNPTVDGQARERAWRIGQLRDVKIYRLLTSQTIEEKIYHRQIFKQFLANRVLQNPRQQRFFKTNDLYELFSYADCQPDTASLVQMEGFANTLTGPALSTGNRFDLLSTSQHNEDPDYDSDVESSPPMGGPFEPLGVDGDQVKSRGGDDSLPDSRRGQLREWAREMSRRIGSGSASSTTLTPPPIKSASENKKRKKKKEMVIDGTSLPQVASSQTHLDHQTDIGEYGKSGGKEFLTTLLGPSTSRDQTERRIDQKRASVDVDLRREAKRIAADALAKLCPLPPAATCSAPVIRSKEQDRGQSKQPCDRLVGKHSRPPPPPNSSPTNARAKRRSRHQQPAVGVASTTSRFKPSLVVDHQLLIDGLTSSQRVDSTFPQLELQSIAQSAVVALRREASSTTSDDVQQFLNSSRLGLIKDRFLYNREEKSSPVFAYYSSIFAQGSLHSSDNTGSQLLTLFGHLPAANPSDGHVRFSSSTLLSLIRARLASRGRQDHNHDCEIPSRRCHPHLLTRLQRLAAFLIRQLPTIDGLSDQQLRRLVRTSTSNTSKDGQFELASALMPCIGVKRHDGRRSRDEMDSRWTLKPDLAFVKHYLSLKLSRAEEEAML